MGSMFNKMKKSIFRLFSPRTIRFWSFFFFLRRSMRETRVLLRKRLISFPWAKEIKPRLFCENHPQHGVEERFLTQETLRTILGDFQAKSIIIHCPDSDSPLRPYRERGWECSMKNSSYGSNSPSRPSQWSNSWFRVKKCFSQFYLDSVLKYILYAAAK